MCGATLPSNITPLYRIDSKKGIIYILLTVLVLSTKHLSPFNVKNATTPACSSACTCLFMIQTKSESNVNTSYTALK